MIVRKWLKTGKFYGTCLPLAVNKLGELDLCLSRIEAWVKDGNEIRFIDPKIAVEFAKSNFKELGDRLVRWMDEPKLLSFSLETTRKLLEVIFERTQEGKNPSVEDRELITSLLSKLQNVALQKGLDSKGIIKREELEIYKCLILIEKIEKDYEELDYMKIWRNLERFPHIKRFFGEKWIKRKERERNRTHPLLILLANDLLDSKEYLKKIEESEKLTDISQKRRETRQAFNSAEYYALLSHLDQELKVIEGRENISKIKDAVRNEEQFWEAFSEIDVIARIAQTFQVKISPRITALEGEKFEDQTPRPRSHD